MPPASEGKPKSYDEIVRKTVVDPDSSVRPALDVERAAREGGRTLDAHERALQAQVVHALAANGITGVAVEVRDDVVVLHGRVADSTRLRALDDIVADISVLMKIRNQVVVDSNRGP